MLHAKSGEPLGMAVFHPRRHRHDHCPPGRVQPFEHTGIDVDVLGDTCELLARHLGCGGIAVDGDRRMKTAIAIAVCVNHDLRFGHEQPPLIKGEESALPRGTCYYYPTSAPRFVPMATGRIGCENWDGQRV